MPIYERKCNGCKAVYSLLSKIEDRDKPNDCPNCDCPDTETIMSATPTNFKFADVRSRKAIR